MVRLEIIRRVIVAEGTLKPALPGDPPRYITVAPKRARELLASRAFRLVPPPPAPEVDGEKKPSGAAPDSPTSGELSLTAPGPETASSSSAAGPRSRRRRSSAPAADETGTGDASASSR